MLCSYLPVSRVQLIDFKELIYCLQKNVNGCNCKLIAYSLNEKGNMEERIDRKKDGKNLNGWMNGQELNLAAIS